MSHPYRNVLFEQNAVRNDNSLIKTPLFTFYSFFPGEARERRGEDERRVGKVGLALERQDERHLAQPALPLRDRGVQTDARESEAARCARARAEERGERQEDERRVERRRGRGERGASAVCRLRLDVDHLDHVHQ